MCCWGCAQVCLVGLFNDVYRWSVCLDASSSGDVHRWNTRISGVLSVTGTTFLGSRVFSLQSRDPLTVPVLSFCAFTSCFICPTFVTQGGCHMRNISRHLSELFVLWFLCFNDVLPGAQPSYDWSVPFWGVLRRPCCLYSVKPVRGEKVTSDVFSFSAVTEAVGMLLRPFFFFALRVTTALVTAICCVVRRHALWF